MSERKNWKEHLKETKATAPKKLNLLKILTQEMGIRPKDAFKNSSNNGHTIYSKVRGDDIWFSNESGTSNLTQSTTKVSDWSSVFLRYKKQKKHSVRQEY
jgi:hypothetical protein